MPLSRTMLFVLVGGLLTFEATAQVWMESGDAPSFPDGAAQVTRGGLLDTIIGSTDAADLRDAYCIKIADPGSFLATTDPLTDPGASGDFDTRLFLFNEYGAPVLANDDTPPSGAPFLSTLTGTATDGSGFELDQPGKYVLVVTGFSEDPQDSTPVDLFDIGSDFDLVHAPNPAAGRFNAWEEPAPATGSYTVILAGVDPCQNHLDAVFGNDFGRNRICQGDGSGGFSSCTDVGADSASTESVALGFVDGDGDLDAVFGNDGGRNRICLGDGSGGFSCTDVSTDSNDTLSVALGELGSSELFADGFESGDTTAWSTTVP